LLLGHVDALDDAAGRADYGGGRGERAAADQVNLRALVCGEEFEVTTATVRFTAAAERAVELVTVARVVLHPCVDTNTVLRARHPLRVAAAARVRAVPSSPARLFGVAVAAVPGVRAVVVALEERAAS